MVVAGLHPVEHRAGQRQAERRPLGLLHHHLTLEATPAQVELHHGLVGLDLVADHVAHGLAVHGEQLVAGSDAGGLGGGTGRDGLDAGRGHRSILRSVPSEP